MQHLYADLHIHIGRSGSGRPVKITASRDLTFGSICRECTERKGLHVAGIVDCASPPVLADIEALVEAGEMVEVTGGGLLYRERLLVLLGSELETREPEGGISHHVCFVPDLAALRSLSDEVGRYVTNRELSSQQCRMPAERLLWLTVDRGGVLVPAHAFTPHKSLYGSCVGSLGRMFSDRAREHLVALELGLSADSGLADRIADLAPLTYLSNSDAHSLPKIGREHNALAVPERSYRGLLAALRREGDARVEANYGLDPRLGKYHRTYCEACLTVTHEPPPVRSCPSCGSDQVTFGVLDRIAEIADTAEPAPPPHRAPYVHQVPLEFVPGLGSVKNNALLNRFGSEMAVLHGAAEDELAAVVGTKLARLIVEAREGRLALAAGGGGHFGKAIADPAKTQLQLGL
jgi:uncharacterized protein (TIGR00375 family)